MPSAPLLNEILCCPGSTGPRAGGIAALSSELGAVAGRPAKGAEEDAPDGSG